MTKIDRIGLPSDLKRRNFLIGSGAAGLAFGYVAVSGVQGVSDALAAGKFEPTAWYSIAPDGKITVMVGKAEMGQHVSSAMAQIVAEELEADWRMMNIQWWTTTQVRRSRSGGADHRRFVERAHELRRDEPGGRRRAHHVDRCGCCHDGRAGQ